MIERDVILELTESKMIVHHFGPPPDGYTPGQHWVTQVMKQVPKRNRCQSTEKDTLTDCQALLDAGYKDNGIYTIHPYQNDEGIKVFCDMTKHTGWIVFQRRVNGSVNFNRSWAEYKKGFGSMDGEFWLGNEILHKLTDAEGNWTVRLDLTNEENKTGHFLKKQFRVGPYNYTMFLEHSVLPPTVGRYCRHKLGMEDGSIPDDKITASSHWSSVFPPSNARLNLNGCWGPAKNQLDHSWLQIFTGSEPVQIEGVITQGRPDRYYWVTQYQVQYSIDGTAWLYVNGDSTPQTFIGNTDGNTPVTNIFQQPIQARYIRIRPTAWVTYPDLRIELLGCKVRWVCRQRLLKQAHINPDESPRLQIDLLLVTLVEGVIAQGKNEPSFQVEYSLDNVTWVYVSHQGAPEGEPQTFHGNTLQSAPLTNVFKQPIRARFIRVTQTDVGHPAVSIELIGCRNDILETANNQAFSIHHHTNNNQHDTNCPGLNSEGGWWFNRCSGIPGVDNNLNAEYIQPGDTMGPYKRVIRATEWNGSRIVKTEIKIRRQSPPRG
ncbi:coagulation factor VIII-like [Asterias amurensis]|uniref:coagulation factor VIII-like n=1 Tax=Asterias amurensis TaxID=7602 RepID=UPI003AB1263B